MKFSLQEDDYKQSEQTAADIQQSASCTQVKRANCRRHPSQGACCRHLLSLPPPPSTPAKRANGRYKPYATVAIFS